MNEVEQKQLREQLSHLIDLVNTSNVTDEEWDSLAQLWDKGNLALATREGAVAVAGPAINSPIIAGNYNIVGDNNQIVIPISDEVVQLLQQVLGEKLAKRARLRVFICLDDEDVEAKGIADQLQELLKEAEFEIFRSADLFSPAPRWREDLDIAVGLSHAAIVLVSARTLVASEESLTYRAISMLAARPLIDQGFVLVPVLLSSVTRQSVDASRLAPLDLDISSTVCGEINDLGQTCQTILARLQPLREDMQERRRPQPRLEQLGETIGRAFEDIRADSLNYAAEHDLHRELLLDIWPGPHTQFAWALWHADVDAIVSAITYLAGHFESDDAMRTLALRIQPGWISPSVACWIPLATKPQHHAIVLNGTEIELLAKTLTRRAYCLIAGDTLYPVAKVNNVTDGGGVASLLRAIRCELQFKLGGGAGDGQTLWSESELQNLLEERASNGKPTFVMIAPSPLLPATVLELRQAFPTVTFVFLVDGSLPDDVDSRYPSAIVPRPGLEPDEDSRALRKFRASLSIS
jgi:hypothetical protein